MSYMNHSDQNNVDVVRIHSREMGLFGEPVPIVHTEHVTNVPIKKGEELTLNYNSHHGLTKVYKF